MRIAIDTNAYVDFLKNNQSRVYVFREATEILLPIIVLAELRAGFASGNRSRNNEKSLAAFLNSPRVSILHIEEETTHRYAQVFAQLKSQGTAIPTNDIWISAICLQHNLPLVSADKHFEDIPQLQII
ncbi:MAG: type II toxin-antitoxin system VapC family toxin [Bdellovibrionota bacterium]